MVVSNTILDIFQDFFIKAKNTHKLLTELQDPETLIKSLTNGAHNESVVFIERLVNDTLPCMLNITQKYVNESVTKVSSTIIKDCVVPALFASNKDNDVLCSVDQEEAVVKFVLVFFSTLMLIMLSCCCKARKSCKTSCCWGRPAPVVPLNMLDNYKNRHGYMLAFGVTVNSCVDVLFGNYARIVGTDLALSMANYPSHVSVLVKISLALVICIIAYPFFIAQNMKNRLFGSILGILYTSVYFSMLLDKQNIGRKKCWPIFEKSNRRQLRILMVVEDLPRLICLALLLLNFCFKLIKTLYQRFYSNDYDKQNYFFQDDIEDWTHSYMYIHVKQVLKKHILKKQQEKLMENADDIPLKQKIKNFIKSKTYTVKPGFQYSTKIMISTLISVLAIYLVILNLCLLGYLIFVKLWNQFLNRDAVIYIAEQLNVRVKLVQKHVDGLQASWWIAIVNALIIYIFVLMNSLTWYRRHVLMLRAGDRSFLPTSIKKGSLDPGTLMTACLKFAGFQVGYSAWGYVINFLVHWLITSLLSSLLFVPLIYGGPSILITLIKKYWLTVVVAVLTIVIQGQFAKRCFLIGMESVSVDNRRTFHVMSYIFFYFNIFIGVVSCILRILYGMILGLIFLPRLPKSTLPRSFERRDPGYLAYLGFLMVEHQHSNPVLQCFVRILMDHINKDINMDEYTTIRIKKEGKISDSMELEKNICNVSTISSFETNLKIRARNRWHLFVILIQNPSIRKYRSQYLKRKSEAKHLTKAMMSAIKPFGGTIDNDYGSLSETGIFKYVLSDERMGIDEEENKNDIEEEEREKDEQNSNGNRLVTNC